MARMAGGASQGKEEVKWSEKGGIMGDGEAVEGLGLGAMACARSYPPFLQPLLGFTLVKLLVQV